MIRFDKLKILVSTDCTLDINKQYATGGISKKQKTVLQANVDDDKKFKLKELYNEWTINDGHGIWGLDTIIYNNIESTVVFTITGKIMGNDYYGLIHKDSIRTAIGTVNQNKFIQFDIDKVINEGSLLLCDVTTNMKVKHKVSDYLDALEQLKINKDYHFSNDKKGTLTFDKLRGKSKGKFYDKHKELLDKKELQPFLAKYPVLDQFENTLRFEQSITNFAGLRKAFGIHYKGKIRLSDILRSKKNLNFDFFKRLSSIYEGWYSEDGVPNDYFKGKDMHAIEKNLGMRSVVRHFDYDMVKIKEFIKSFRSKKSNSGVKVKEYEKFINEHREDWKHDLLTEVMLHFKYGKDADVKYTRAIWNRNVIDDEKTQDSDSDESYEYNKCVLFDDEDGIPSEDEDIDKEYATAELPYLVK